MKPLQLNPRHLRSGFTRVELVVVIVIIAILVLVLFPVSPNFRPGPRSHANMLVSQIQTAVMAYDTEYGHLPVAKANEGKDTYYSADNASAWASMTIALCGNIDPADPDKKIDPSLMTIPNERKITFLNLKKSDLDLSSGVGVVKQPFPDRNGKAQFFFMAIDSNGDGVLGDKDQPAGKLPDFSRGALSGAKITNDVVVWSNCAQDPSDPKKMNFWVHTY